MHVDCSILCRNIERNTISRFCWCHISHCFKLFPDHFLSDSVETSDVCTCSQLSLLITATPVNQLCLSHQSLPPLTPSSPVVSPLYLSLSSQPEKDTRLFIADKAANFINYEPICCSVRVCVWSNGGDLKVP